eukprot:TRINITY_DN98381_c0_g1_i1.p1 TRINITY_DN98381_c0_g1~~TRINITY_DN98381_c0_g1_i1.p1  ORF type:complete len:133 (-),score=11.53 TRINITY_DN98381_c0_g1_i1:22-420(-)
MCSIFAAFISYVAVVASSATAVDGAEGRVLISCSGTSGGSSSECLSEETQQSNYAFATVGYSAMVLVFGLIACAMVDNLMCKGRLCLKICRCCQPSNKAFHEAEMRMRDDPNLSCVQALSGSADGSESSGSA